MGDKIDGDVDVEYSVEKILRRRTRQGNVEYLIKWKDYSDDENTWEPETNLNLNCQSLLEELKEKKLKNNTKQYSKKDAAKCNGIQENVTEQQENIVTLQPNTTTMVQELISPSTACDLNLADGIDALRRRLSYEIGLNFLNPCYFHTTSYHYLEYFQKEWFQGMDVLHIGCNEGYLTLTVAREMSPRNIIGMDAAGYMIRAAKETLVQMIQQNDSLSASNKDPGIGHDVATDGDDVNRAERTEKKFPFNVLFVQGDYVLPCDEQLAKQNQNYNTILCLNLTKWVHLKWGDKGLIRLFKRMYLQLKPGGRLILEYQALKSYRRLRKMSKNIRDNYKNIRLIPELFIPYLLSWEIGFTRCEVLNMQANPTERDRKPIVVFTKGPPGW